MRSGGNLFLIPTDWTKRPAGPLEPNPSCPFLIYFAVNLGGGQRKRAFGQYQAAYNQTRGVTFDRNGVRISSGALTIAENWWFAGGACAFIFRPNGFISGTNQLRTNQSGGGNVGNPSWSDGSYNAGNFNGFTGTSATWTAGTFADLHYHPFFTFSAPDNTTHNATVYDTRGRRFANGQRTTASGALTTAAQAVTCFNVAGGTGQDRIGTLSEMIYFRASLDLHEMDECVRDFYGIFWRSVVERTYFVPAPAAGVAAASLAPVVNHRRMANLIAH